MRCPSSVERTVAGRPREAQWSPRHQAGDRGLRDDFASRVIGQLVSADAVHAATPLFWHLGATPWRGKRRWGPRRRRRQEGGGCVGPLFWKRTMVDEGSNAGVVPRQFLRRFVGVLDGVQHTPGQDCTHVQSVRRSFGWVGSRLWTAILAGGWGSDRSQRYAGTPWCPAVCCTPSTRWCGWRSDDARRGLGE